MHAGALLFAALATGCTGGDEGVDASPSEGEPSAGPGSSDSARPTAPSSPDSVLMDFAPDPDREPENAAEALRVARKVIAKPHDWGPGFVEGSTESSGPLHVSELNDDCSWEQRPLSSSEFVSIVGRSELPAKGDAGPLRVSAVVTIHRTEDDARWKMARTLEEPLRCPGQRLNSTERISGLRSGGDLSPDPDGNTDLLQESGEIHSELPGSPHPYVWDVSRLGKITLAVSVKGGRGHERQEVLSTGSKAIGVMAARVQLEIGERT